MTNKIALIIGAIVFAAVLADQVLNHGNAIVFLGRKLLLLIEYIAFWR